eukprot:9016325-Pyramimonas_sp.AAC.1
MDMRGAPQRVTRAQGPPARISWKWRGAGRGGAPPRISPGRAHNPGTERERVADPQPMHRGWPNGRNQRNQRNVCKQTPH